MEHLRQQLAELKELEKDMAAVTTGATASGDANAVMELVKLRAKLSAMNPGGAIEHVEIHEKNLGLLGSSLQSIRKQISELTAADDGNEA